VWSFLPRSGGLAIVGHGRGDAAVEDAPRNVSTQTVDWHAPAHAPAYERDKFRPPGR
jgi:hypothetical protein